MYSYEFKLRDGDVISGEYLIDIAFVKDTIILTGIYNTEGRKTYWEYRLKNNMIEYLKIIPMEDECYGKDGK